MKIGVIGTGVIANVEHLPGIAGCKDFTLTALCDIDPEALAETAEKYNIPADHCFTDYNQLLQSGLVEAVSIATPNDAHFAIAMATAKAGLPFALEKPITLTVEEAEELERTAQEHQVANMVCFSYRFRASARYARDLIKKGELGEIYHVNMQYYQAWGLPYFEMPLVWRFQKKRTGTGALGDLGSHALDLVSFVLDEDYTRITGQLGTLTDTRPLEQGGGQGRVDVDDYCNFMADTQQGVSATFQITRFAHGRGNYQRMEVYGSKGSLIYTLDRYGNIDEIELCLGQQYGETKTFALVDAPEQYQSKQMQSFADIALGKEDGLAATLTDGLKNQRAMQAVVDSAQQGQWITL